MTKGKQSSLVVVAIGANVAGPWGSPLQTIETALRKLRAEGIVILARSRLYLTPAVGYSPQPDYLNAVVLLGSPLPPASLMRRLRAIERRAGRRVGKPWGPRPLDLDLLSFRGMRTGRRRPGGKPAAHLSRPLVLPHPELEKRAFVLVPLRDVAPFFRNPESGRSLAELIHALPARAVRQCIPLDNSPPSCDI